MEDDPTDALQPRESYTRTDRYALQPRESYRTVARERQRATVRQTGSGSSTDRFRERQRATVVTVAILMAVGLPRRIIGRILLMAGR